MKDGEKHVEFDFVVDFLADIFDLSAIILGFGSFSGFLGRYFQFIGHHFEIWLFFWISWPIKLHKKYSLQTEKVFHSINKH